MEFLCMISLYMLCQLQGQPLKKRLLTVRWTFNLSYRFLSKAYSLCETASGPHVWSGCSVHVHWMWINNEQTLQQKVVIKGLEPLTNGLLDQRSTNWAKRPTIRYFSLNHLNHYQLHTWSSYLPGVVVALGALNRWSLRPGGYHGAIPCTLDLWSGTTAPSGVGRTHHFC